MDSSGLGGEARGAAGGGGGGGGGAEEAAGARGAGCSGSGGEGWRHLLRWEPSLPGEATGVGRVWEGETPWAALLSLCAAGRGGDGVPLPACRLREAPGGQFFGECFLSHMGVLVAPHCAFASEEEALQNTALLVLAYLRGALPLGAGSPAIVRTGAGESLLGAVGPWR